MLTKLIYNSIQPYSTLKAFIKKHKLELRSGFKEFYNFSLSLIESLDEKNGHLKFAVVNMQIALELFLKYYFLSKEMPERVFKEPLLSGVYKDFSDILKSYYSVCRELHLSPKKRLITILENRNNIVHKGRFHEWDNELAQSIIECAFFIQHVSMFNFNESLVSAQYLPHKLSKNIHWKKGAQSIANNLCIKSAKQPMECPFCLSKTLVSKEIFALDEAQRMARRNAVFDAGDAAQIEHVVDTRSHALMRLDQQYPDCHGPGRRVVGDCRGNGTVNIPTVPLPGEDRISAVPPSSESRSRTLISPSPRCDPVIT